MNIPSGNMSGFSYDPNQFNQTDMNQIYPTYDSQGNPLPQNLSVGAQSDARQNLGVDVNGNAIPIDTYFADLEGLDENDPKRRRIARVSQRSFCRWY